MNDDKCVSEYRWVGVCVSLSVCVQNAYSESFWKKIYLKHMNTEDASQQVAISTHITEKFPMQKSRPLAKPLILPCPMSSAKRRSPTGVILVHQINKFYRIRLTCLIINPPAYLCITPLSPSHPPHLYQSKSRPFTQRFLAGTPAAPPLWFVSRG